MALYKASSYICSVKLQAKRCVRVFFNNFKACVSTVHAILWIHRSGIYRIECFIFSTSEWETQPCSSHCSEPEEQFMELWEEKNWAAKSKRPNPQSLCRRLKCYGHVGSVRGEHAERSGQAVAIHVRGRDCMGLYIFIFGLFIPL